MGSGCPKGVHMQIIKETGGKHEAKWEENCCSKKAQTIIWSPDYVTCIHSLLFESLLWVWHWYRYLYNHRIVLHRVTCFCVLFWLCLFYFFFYLFLKFPFSFPIPLLITHLFLRGGHQPLKYIEPLQAVAPSAGIQKKKKKWASSLT